MTSTSSCAAWFSQSCSQHKSLYMLGRSPCKCSLNVCTIWDIYMQEAPTLPREQAFHPSSQFLDLIRLLLSFPSSIQIQLGRGLMGCTADCASKYALDSLIAWCAFAGSLCKMVTGRTQSFHSSCIIKIIHVTCICLRWVERAGQLLDDPEKVFREVPGLTKLSECLFCIIVWLDNL